MSATKLTLASLLDRLGVSAALLRAQRALADPHVRIVNYHDVPAARARDFEAQLGFYAQHFAPVGRGDLPALLRGEWPHAKPGLAISFDDGLRSHAEVAAPLLERHGFVGWFFAPIGFLDAPVAQQREWAIEHQIGVQAQYADERVALSWDEARALDRKHVVGCHTWNHTRLRAELTSDQLEREISRAKQRLEAELGRVVDHFCWVGGEEETYSASAARAIRASGFRYGFMTNNQLVRPGANPLQLQRTNIEASDPIELVRFQLSGILDLLYTPKRRRVNRLTGE
jgi:peptidoglycan/xylan/chitin deacetylase (PgdA/CDA1 family)